MLGCDFVFADGEFNPETLEYSALEDALRFVFRTLPALRDEGWEVIESPAWPYHVSDADVELSVSTQGEEGAAFQGNDCPH